MSEQNGSNSADGAGDEQSAKQEASSNQDTTAALKADLEKAKNDFLYLRAEFDTFRRNAIKERSDMQKYGSERVIAEVLGVLDNFERALQMKVTADNLSQFTKGIELTATELKQALVKFGVSEVASLHKPFDPACHEALGAEESSDVPAGHITQVYKKPYKLHDKVIRHGQVLVAKEGSSKQ